MEKLIKMVIADDEPYICGMLKKLIQFDELGVEFIDCIYDGESLLKKVEKEQPDIVLTDICMPRLDGLEVIRIAKERGLKCRFVVISGYRQFEYAYNALKYEVEDYILKPVDGRELNSVLKKICDSLRQSELSGTEKNDSAIRTYLIEKAVHEELQYEAMPLEEINKRYHTHFKPGLYRVILVKLDYSRNTEHIEITEDISSVIKKMREVSVIHFHEKCHDVLIADKRDGVMLLLNYDSASDAELKAEIQSVFKKIKTVIDLFQGLKLTVCVGKAVSETGKIIESKQSCRRADWVRMNIGTDRVIFSEEIEEGLVADYQSRFDEIEENLVKAFIILDSESVRSDLMDFFSLPSKILGSTEAMVFIRRIIDKFCDIYKTITKDAADDEMVYSRISRGIHLKSNFVAYRNELIDQMCGNLDRAAERIKEKNAKPVRQACVYIERNYAKHLTMEGVAQEVNLSPAYFSNLFKKETGQNFTEYIIDYRIRMAKDMLKNSDKNVSEIAEALGFADSRYFSKLFKKEVGVKPTDYRNIYG